MTQSRRDFLQATSLLAAPVPRRDYDVAVYGGVPCGIAAAIAAAREGAKVLLIEPTSTSIAIVAGPTPCDRQPAGRSL